MSPVTFRPPAVLAKLALTADHVSGGRVDVGIGTGWNEAEHEAFGLPFPPLPERMTELERQVEEIQRLSRARPGRRRRSSRGRGSCWAGPRSRAGPASLRVTPARRRRLRDARGGGATRRAACVVTRLGGGPRERAFARATGSAWPRRASRATAAAARRARGQDRRPVA